MFVKQEHKVINLASIIAFYCYDMCADYSKPYLIRFESTKDDYNHVDFETEEKRDAAYEEIIYAISHGIKVVKL